MLAVQSQIHVHHVNKKKNTVQIKIMTNRIIDFLFHAAYSFFRRRAQFCHFLLNSAHSSAIEILRLTTFAVTFHLLTRASYSDMSY